MFPEYDVDQLGSAGLGGSAGASASGGSVQGSGDGGMSGADATSGASGTVGGRAGASAVAGGSSGSSGAAGAAGDAGSAGAGAGGECSTASCPPSTCEDGVKGDDEAHIDCGDALGKCDRCRFDVTKFVIGGGTTISGSAQVTWNASSIVFEFTVVDGTVRDDSSDPWNDDAIEVYLDLNNGKTSTYEADDFQIIVPRDESPIVSPQQAGTGAMLVERSSNATGYKLTLTVPWSTIGVGSNPPLGKLIGFDLAIDDDANGGGRDAQVVAFGVSDNYLNTSQFGEIELVQ